MALRIFFILLALLYIIKWDVKNGFAYVLQFFSLISDGIDGVFWIKIGHIKYM